MGRRSTALAGSVLLLAAGCGGSPTAPPAAPTQAPRPVSPAPQSPVAAPGAVPVSAPAPASPVAAVPAQGPMAPAGASAAAAAPGYDSKGRRDPFETLETREGTSAPLVASAKLAGIVRSPRGPMALVETADGLGYILKPGDTLGDGRLVQVGQDSVVFSVVARRGSTTNRVVLRLPGD